MLERYQQGIRSGHCIQAAVGHILQHYLVKDEQQLLIKPLRAKCLRKGQAG